MFEELLPVLLVLEVEDAGDEADDAVVRLEPASRPLPLGGDVADEAAADLDEPPAGLVIC